MTLLRRIKAEVPRLLIGFKISPILWTKLSGVKSAGRVQSVALKIICEREIEIENFKSQRYWSITSSMSAKKWSKFYSISSIY